MLSGNVILFTPRMWLYWILINDSLGKSRLVNSWKGNLLHSGEREASGYFRQWGSLEELFPSPGNPWWFQRKKLPHWVQSKLGYIGQPIQHVRVFRLPTQKIRMLQILTSYTAEYATVQTGYKIGICSRANLSNKWPYLITNSQIITMFSSK